MGQNALRQFLVDAAQYARMMELSNDRIDAIDIGIFPHGVAVTARRNRLAQRHSLSVSWEEIELAVSNPLLAMIDGVTAEINKEPTTRL